MFYEWTESLSVGIPSIDKQHKVLISLINDLNEAIENGEGQHRSKTILKKIISYAKVHFIYEESLFTRFNYELSEDHLNSHRSIEKQLLDLKDKSIDSTYNLPDELMGFLKNWLNNHILKEDITYTKVLLAHNIE